MSFRFGFQGQESDPKVKGAYYTDEVKFVFNTCDSWLEKALIALAYDAGLQRGSLENLLESKIDFKSGMVTAFKDKNNKTIRVSISNFFLEVLKEYCVFRLNILATLNIRETHFFNDHKGKHLSGDNPNEMLKTYCQTDIEYSNHEQEYHFTLHSSFNSYSFNGCR